MNNYVDAVEGFAIPSGETETHGLSASCIIAAIGDILISGNTVKNTDGQNSVEGDEGILGRGHSVIVTNNILLDAGMREGCIYAKGSEYHEISHNIIEVSLTHPLLSLTRGIISASDEGYASIHGNKFINTAFGIYSRSLNEKVENNEFINNSVQCHTLALENGTNHIKTEVNNNYADDMCGVFFGVATTSSHTVTYGDFHVTDNRIYVKDSSVILKEANNFVFNGNFVNRVIPTATRDCIQYKEEVGFSVIKNNTVVSFDNSLNTGRFLTGFSNLTPRIIASNNSWDGIGTVFYLAGATIYTDLIITGNSFLGSVGTAAIGGISVTGEYFITDNVGANMDTRHASTSDFTDITSAINISNSKIQGFQAYNTQSNVTVFAVGSADGDIWVDSSGSTAYTPV